MTSSAERVLGLFLVNSFRTPEVQPASQPRLRRISQSARILRSPIKLSASRRSVRPLEVCYQDIGTIIYRLLHNAGRDQAC